MTARTFLVFVVFGAAAVLLGRTTPLGLALALVVGLALMFVLLFEQAENRRIHDLAGEINAWLGRDEHRPVALAGGEAWRELAVSLNALGAAYHRRGARLRRERPWRRELVDSLVTPALLFADDNRLLAANDAARRLLAIPGRPQQVTAAQALGSPALVTAVKEARLRQVPVTVDTQYDDRELRSVISRVGEETLVMISDRTRELRVEELRRNFVVNASHELKTPVTGIQTLSEAIDITLRDDPARAAELVGRLRDEAERLATLVHDLLDLRRLEERAPLEQVPVDLAELVRQTVVGLLPDAERAGVQIDVDVPERAMMAGVVGDLRLIVKNLVGNALKYNQPGGRVEITLTSASGWQTLRVRDTGIGIPQQDLTRIFERFYRVDVARSRETGGTGLGLSIVRHAVERHGGTVTVDSLLGEGTTFTVTLPIETV